MRCGRAASSAVVACSALKRAYRDILIGDRTDVVLVYLQGSKALIAGRIAARKGHFMPPALLDSQFATLEEPGADEHPIVVVDRADAGRDRRRGGAATEGAHSMSGELRASIPACATAWCSSPAAPAASAPST